MDRLQKTGKHLEKKWTQHDTLCRNAIQGSAWHRPQSRYSGLTDDQSTSKLISLRGNWDGSGSHPQCCCSTCFPLASPRVFLLKPAARDPQSWTSWTILLDQTTRFPMFIDFLWCFASSFQQKNWEHFCVSVWKWCFWWCIPSYTPKFVHILVGKMMINPAKKSGIPQPTLALLTGWNGGVAGDRIHQLRHEETQGSPPRTSQSEKLGAYHTEMKKKSGSAHWATGNIFNGIRRWFSQTDLKPPNKNDSRCSADQLTIISGYMDPDGLPWLVRMRPVGSFPMGKLEFSQPSHKCGCVVLRFSQVFLHQIWMSNGFNDI